MFSGGRERVHLATNGLIFLVNAIKFLSSNVSVETMEPLWKRHTGTSVG